MLGCNCVWYVLPGWLRSWGIVLPQTSARSRFRNVIGVFLDRVQMSVLSSAACMWQRAVFPLLEHEKPRVNPHCGHENDGSTVQLKLAGAGKWEQSQKSSSAQLSVRIQCRGWKTGKHCYTSSFLKCTVRGNLGSFLKDFFAFLCISDYNPVMVLGRG